MREKGDQGATSVLCRKYQAHLRSAIDLGYWTFCRDPHDADNAYGVNPTVPAIRARDAGYDLNSPQLLGVKSVSASAGA